MPRLQTDSTWTGLAWISPWIVGFLAFLALPIGLSLYWSLTDYPLLEPPVFIGLDNYKRLLHDPVFGRVLLNTITYAAISIPLGTIIAVVIAALLDRPITGRWAFRAAVFLPSLVPVAAAAMIWMWLFNGELGLVNRSIEFVFGPLGIHGPDWLGHGTWAMAAMILISVWGIGPSVVIYLAALQDVPRDLHAAAALDGFGPLQRFRHITLPLISPVILFNVIVAIINAWQVFALPYIMTGGGPDRATHFYSMYLYESAFPYNQMGYACAMAWIQLLIILIMTITVLQVGRKLVFYRSA